MILQTYRKLNSTIPLAFEIAANYNWDDDIGKGCSIENKIPSDKPMAQIVTDIFNIYLK